MTFRVRIQLQERRGKGLVQTWLSGGHSTNNFILLFGPDMSFSTGSILCISLSSFYFIESRLSAPLLLLLNNFSTTLFADDCFA